MTVSTHTPTYTDTLGRSWVLETLSIDERSYLAAMMLCEPYSDQLSEIAREDAIKTVRADLTSHASQQQRSTALAVYDKLTSAVSLDLAKLATYNGLHAVLAVLGDMCQFDMSNHANDRDDDQFLLDCSAKLDIVLGKQ